MEDELLGPGARDPVDLRARRDAPRPGQRACDGNRHAFRAERGGRSLRRMAAAGLPERDPEDHGRDRHRERGGAEMTAVDAHGL